MYPILGTSPILDLIKINDPFSNKITWHGTFLETSLVNLTCARPIFWDQKNLQFFNWYNYAQVVTDPHFWWWLGTVSGVLRRHPWNCWDWRGSQLGNGVMSITGAKELWMSDAMHIPRSILGPKDQDFPNRTMVSLWRVFLVGHHCHKNSKLSLFEGIPQIHRPGAGPGVMNFLAWQNPDPAPVLGWLGYDRISMDMLPLVSQRM